MVQGLEYVFLLFWKCTSFFRWTRLSFEVPFSDIFSLRLFATVLCHSRTATSHLNIHLWPHLSSHAPYTQTHASPGLSPNWRRDWRLGYSPWKKHTQDRLLSGPWWQLPDCEAAEEAASEAEPQNCTRKVAATPLHSNLWSSWEVERGRRSQDSRLSWLQTCVSSLLLPRGCWDSGLLPPSNPGWPQTHPVAKDVLILLCLLITPGLCSPGNQT